MSKGIDMGTAIALMKSISGAVDVSAAQAAKTAAETAQGKAEAAETSAESYAALAAERAFAVTTSGTTVIFTSAAESTE